MSGIVKGAGQIFQGVSQRNMSRQRSTLLKRDAREALNLGAIRADLVNEDKTRAIGDAVSVQGASGFTMDAGAMAVIRDMASGFEFQARTARYEARRTSQRLINEAHGATARGNAALTKSLFDATGSVLKAAEDGASKVATGGQGGGG